VSADLDRLADEWVRSQLGADLTADEWPDPDHGRIRGQVGLDVNVLASDLEQIDRRPLPKVPTGLLCSHCGLAPADYRRVCRHGQELRDLCERCRKHFVRTGRLPSRELNRRHRARLGLSPLPAVSDICQSVEGESTHADPEEPVTPCSEEDER